MKYDIAIVFLLCLFSSVEICFFNTGAPRSLGFWMVYGIRYTVDGDA